MDRRAVLEASAVTVAGLSLWWGGITAIDGALAVWLPYDRYATAALFYPDVFYPALPGWMLAHSQPYGVGVWLVTIGWLVGSVAALGVGATKYAARRGVPPAAAAAVFVVALFVGTTVVEAGATLLG